MDIIAPETVILSGPATYHSGFVANFSFFADDGGGSGVATYRYQVNDGPVLDTDGASSLTLGVSNGAYSVKVWAVDLAGNVDLSPAISTFLVDTTAPETGIVSAPANTSALGTATFAFSGSDAGSGIAAYYVTLDGGSEIVTSSLRTYVGLSDGAHTLSIRARDLAGNFDETPAVYTWTVDKTAPTVVAVTTSPDTGTVDPGTAVVFTLAMSEVVTVSGLPKLTLNNGGIATYLGGSGTDTLTFSYVVAPGQATSNLVVTGYAENGGGIVDGVGRSADMSGAAVDPPGVLAVGGVAPILAAAIADQTVGEDSAWTFTLPAGTFFDADGDTLVYSATLGDGGVLPAWLSFNPTVRQFSGTPPPNFAGIIDLKVTATDGHSSAWDVFRLTVNAVPDAATITLPTGGDVIDVWEDGIGGASFASFFPHLEDGDAGQLTFSIGATAFGSTVITQPDDAGAGKIAYALDNALAAIQRLVGGATITETITVTSADGSASRTLMVRIHGSDGAPINGTSAADANLVGTMDRETIDGKAGNDTFRGELAGDTLIGGAGNDRFELGGWVTAAIVETSAAGSGTDLIVSSISRALTNFANVENLTLTGSAGLSGTGNALANAITGNAGANTLDGGAGADALIGGGGIDTLVGGLGIDTLTGGAGNDCFVFNVAISAANRDVITDFRNISGDNDTIRLENAVFTKIGAVGALKPSAFKVTTLARDADDRILYNKITGALFYDPDGAGAAAPIQIAQFTTIKPTLTHLDFVVI